MTVVVTKAQVSGDMHHPSAAPGDPQMPVLLPIIDQNIRKPQRRTLPRSAKAIAAARLSGRSYSTQCFSNYRVTGDI
jgi:hypothetical protein